MSVSDTILTVLASMGIGGVGTGGAIKAWLAWASKRDDALIAESNSKGEKHKAEQAVAHATEADASGAHGVVLAAFKMTEENFAHIVGQVSEQHRLILSLTELRESDRAKFEERKAYFEAIAVAAENRAAAAEVRAATAERQRDEANARALVADERAAAAELRSSASDARVAAVLGELEQHRRASAAADHSLTHRETKVGGQ